jgi:hypothetical protein
VLRRWYPEREIVAVADRAYASLKLLDRSRKQRKPITFITRLRLDSALYEPAPPRYPGQIGRPRIKGERLPNLSEVAKDPTTVWKLTTIANWYGESERMVEIACATAVWYSTGLPAVPVRWVLIRDPQGEFKTQALLCTDLEADPEEILSWFVMRWQLEVTFQEVRRHLGFETQRQWSELAIRRTTPALLGLFSVVSYGPEGFDTHAEVLKDDGRGASALSAAGQGSERHNVGAVPSQENLQRLARLLEARTLWVPVKRTYELEQAGEGLRALATEHTQGKWAIRVA